MRVEVVEIEMDNKIFLIISIQNNNMKALGREMKVFISRTCLNAQCVSWFKVIFLKKKKKEIYL